MGPRIQKIVLLGYVKMPSVPSPIKYTYCVIYDGLEQGNSQLGILRRYTETGLHKPTIMDPVDATAHSDNLYYCNIATQLYRFSDPVVPHIGNETSTISIPFNNQADADAGTDSSGSNIFKLEDMRFIELGSVDGLGNKMPVFGWIDGYSIRGSGGPYATAEIRWHIDYYLTFMNQLSYGCGRIKRGPADIARPDTSVPRKWIYDSSLGIDPSGAYQGDGSVTAQNDRQWIIIMVSSNVGKLTDFSYYVWQDGMILNNVFTPYMEEIYDGKVADRLGLDPDKIVGAWISPIPPFAMNATSAAAQIYTYGSGPDERACFKFDQILNTKSEYTCTYLTEKCTTDSEKWILVDLYGTPRLTAPWGIEWDTIKLILDIGTAGANLIVYLQDSSDTTDINEGRITTVPLPSIPILSNAFSSYVYSGQRDYDIQSRELQNQQQALNGIAGSGQSAISGGIAGGVSKAGGAVGAVAGFATQIAGSLVGYGINTVYGNEEQKLTDKLAANQASAPIITGQSLVWKYFDGFLDQTSPTGSHNWRFVKMVRDSVSAAELADEQSELGFNTDSFQSDCSGFINDGGPLRIEGLEVREIGTVGANYVSAMFARGVHLDVPTP